MNHRPYHHGDLRAALLARAEQTLREKGLGALSLRELARGLGVSPAAPNRHFKTKESLLDALALTGLHRLSDAIACSQEGIGETFAEQLNAAARAYVNFATTNPALLELMYSVKHSSAASPELRAGVYGWTEHLVEAIRSGQRRGEVRDAAIERVALPIVASLHGYADLAASGTLPVEAAGHGLDDVIASILRGCAPE
ncbi:TetR/AcrR family transcriptional regulator [Streptomyces sp. NPDC006733]|uniref:TetR/AcrR family transcriptional regulator n=1 Tax=Streptomyces sp. NPDC006733 TaxID=3155460 RepID=UPI0033EE8378